MHRCQFRHFRRRRWHIRRAIGVSLDMRRFWRVVLPIVGLLLFSIVSWHDFRINKETHSRLPNKYFMWSAIRLDTDPTNQRTWNSQTCKEGEEHCISWELTNTWVDPGPLDGSLLVTAFPAFIFGRLFVGLLGTMGVNELTSFMLLMPPLLLIWYYFIGRLLDRWLLQRSKRSVSSSG